MATVGAGVYEIRVRAGTAYRVFYVAKYDEAVYVWHAFEKRRRQTPQADIELARKRLADLLRRRTQKQETP